METINDIQRIKPMILKETDILTLTLERRKLFTNKKIAIQSKLQNPTPKEIILRVKELKRRLEEYD